MNKKPNKSDDFARLMTEDEKNDKGWTMSSFADRMRQRLSKVRGVDGSQEYDFFKKHSLQSTHGLV